MSRNELTFSIGDGEEGEFLLTEPAPAPEAPASGFAEVVNTPEQEVLQEIKEDLDTRREAGEFESGARKRARRFHADTPFVLGVLLFLVAAMAAASFYVSFSGLFAAAAWAVGDNPPLQFAVPVMLDIAIIAFTLSLFIQRERGEKVWGTWLAIGAFATVSATANILHTLVVSTATDNYQLLVGSIISGGAPILLAFATDSVAIKVFKSAHPVEK